MAAGCATIVSCTVVAKVMQETLSILLQKQRQDKKSVVG